MLVWARSASTRPRENAGDSSYGEWKTNSPNPLNPPHSPAFDTPAHRLVGDAGILEPEAAFEAPLVLRDELAEVAAVDGAAPPATRAWPRAAAAPFGVGLRLLRCGVPVASLIASATVTASPGSSRATPRAAAPSCARTGSRPSTRSRPAHGSAMPSHTSGLRTNRDQSSNRAKFGTLHLRLAGREVGADDGEHGRRQLGRAARGTSSWRLTANSRSSGRSHAGSSAQLTVRALRSPATARLLPVAKNVAALGAVTVLLPPSSRSENAGSVRTVHSASDLQLALDVVDDDDARAPPSARRAAACAPRPGRRPGHHAPARARWRRSRAGSRAASCRSPSWAR